MDNSAIVVIDRVRRLIEELSERKIKKNVVTSENGAGSANKGGQGDVSKKTERRDNDNGTAATKNKG